MAGDLGGEVLAGLADFLKNLDADLFGGEGWRGEEGEPLRDEEEGRGGRAVEMGGDCGESVSFWGTECESSRKGMNKRYLGRAGIRLRWNLQPGGREGD